MARSPMLNDLIEKRICDALRNGHSYNAAARAGGVSEQTVHTWRARGRAGESRYVEFLERTDRADQEAEDRAVQVILGALASEDERLRVDTAWKWLARRRPDQWAEVRGGAEEKPLTEQEAKQILEAFTKAKTG